MSDRNCPTKVSERQLSPTNSKLDDHYFCHTCVMDFSWIRGYYDNPKCPRCLDPMSRAHIYAPGNLGIAVDDEINTPPIIPWVGSWLIALADWIG